MLTPKKPKKKPVATPKSLNWHWFFFLFFFGFFWFFKISKLALVFFGFFWFFLALVLARIRNWKLVFFVSFGFFGFFGFFFGLSFGQHSKLETGFWAFLVFFWFFLGFFGFFLAFDFRVRMSSQKKPKKTKKNKKNHKNQKKPKKPVATPKLVNWLGFFWFFFGVSTPPLDLTVQELKVKEPYRASNAR